MKGVIAVPYVTQNSIDGVLELWSVGIVKIRTLQPKSSLQYANTPLLRIQIRLNLSDWTFYIENWPEKLCKNVLLLYTIKSGQKRILFSEIPLRYARGWINPWLRQITYIGNKLVIINESSSVAIPPGYPEAKPSGSKNLSVTARRKKTVLSNRLAKSRLTILFGTF